MPHSSERLWNRGFVVLCAYAVALGSVLNLTFTPLALYAVDLGGGQVGAGLMTALFTWSAVLFRPILGPFLDSHGRKGILLAGSVLLVITTGAYAFVSDLTLIYVLRFVQGLALAATSLAAGTLVADVTAHAKLGEAMGIYMMAFVVSSLFAPTLAVSWAVGSRYDLVFLSSTVLAAAALAVSFLMPKDKVHGPAEGQRQGFWEPTAISLSLALFFASLGIGFVISFLAPWAKSRGIVGFEWFFLVNALALVGIRLVSGPIFLKFGLKASALVGAGIFAVSWVIGWLSQDLTVFLCFAVLNALGFGILQPALNTLVLHRSPGHRKAAANAFIISSVDAGAGMGAVAGGAVQQAWGWEVLVLAVIASATLCLLLLVRDFLAHRDGLATGTPNQT